MSVFFFVSAFLSRSDAILKAISDLSYPVTALFALGRRTGQKNALRFEAGFSRCTGIARGFRDQILGEGTEGERSEREAVKMGEVGEIMNSCRYFRGPDCSTEGLVVIKLIFS